MKPKQYQQGWAEFYKLKFKLTPDVLIPRPETELIVEEVIRIVHRSSLIVNRNHSKTIANDTLSILEVGTGSGCIAISIAKNLPQVKIIASDVSAKALEIAKLNAKFHKVEDQIIFLESDLLDFIKDKNPTSEVGLDVIVANLPYIPTARLMMLDPMVKDFEPKLALDGGRDGFELYRKLFSQMVEKKLFPKFLIIEIDSTQSEVCLAEARKYFPYAQGYIKMDLAKLERFLVLEF